MCAVAAAFAWAEHWTLNMQAGGTGVRKDDPASTRRRNAAHKRFMVSLRTLAQIQRAESAQKRAVRSTSSWWPEVFGARSLNGG